MIPFVGRAPWTLFDFVFAGTVLFGSATLYEVTTKNVENQTQRMILGGAILMGILLIWAWAVA